MEIKDKKHRIGIQEDQRLLKPDKMCLFLKVDGIGTLMSKARSIDVTNALNKIFKEEESKLKTSGFKVVEKVKLES